jgi:hypothetical protein
MWDVRSSRLACWALSLGEANHDGSVAPIIGQSFLYQCHTYQAAQGSSWRLDQARSLKAGAAGVLNIMISALQGAAAVCQKPEVSLPEA